MSHAFGLRPLGGAGQRVTEVNQVVFDNSPRVFPFGLFGNTYMESIKGPTVRVIEPCGEDP